MRVTTSADQWTLIDEVFELNYERRINRESRPGMIDLIPLDAKNVSALKGIYKIEGETLTIAWGPIVAPTIGWGPPRDPAERPIDFSGKTGTIQTFLRIESVPNPGTPQQ